MKLVQLEHLVITTIDRLQAGEQTEFDRIELKSSVSEFGDIDRAARQLAGMCNKARGEEVVWVIGAREDGTIVGAEKSEVGAWWRSVAAKFDGIAPEMSLEPVQYEAHALIALAFTSHRAPYLITIPDTDRLEVPWRDGDATRSARHNDLLRILVPAVAAPQVSVIDASLALALDEEGQIYIWALQATLYVEFDQDRPLVIPDHQVTAEIVSPTDRTTLMEFGDIKADDTEPIQFPPRRDAMFVQPVARAVATRAHDFQVVIDGPGPIRIHANNREEVTPQYEGTRVVSELEIRLTLRPAMADRPVLIPIRLTRDEDTRTDAIAAWTLA